MKGTTTMRTIYSAGQNLAGYMPMADEPALFEDADDARAYLLDDLDRYADALAMMDEDPDTPMEQVDDAIDDLRTADVSSGWSTMVDYRSGTLVFWIDAVEVEDDFSTDQDD